MRAVTTTTTLNTDQPDRRLIDSAELRKMLPVARTTFYKTIARPEFPTPIQLIDGGDYLWWSDEIDIYLESRRRHPGEPTPAPAAPTELTEPVVAIRAGSSGARRAATAPIDESPAEITVRPRNRSKDAA